MVTVYTRCADPFFAVIFTSFSPSAQTAEVPLVCGSPFTVMVTVASSAPVAATVLLLLVVLAVYSVTFGSNAGVSVSAPSPSDARDAVKGFPPQYWPCRAGR